MFGPSPAKLRSSMLDEKGSQAGIGRVSRTVMRLPMLSLMTGVAAAAGSPTIGWAAEGASPRIVVDAAIDGTAAFGGTEINWSAPRIELPLLAAMI